MSILQRQLRIFLAVFLVASLLLAGIVTGQAAATPCGDGDHHGAMAPWAQVDVSGSWDIYPASVPSDDLAACCSMSATTCCASAAIRCDDAIALNQLPIRSAWLAATMATLRGLGDEVNRRPPRLA